MDIERLIKEQKETQKLLKDLRGLKSFDEFLETIPETELDVEDFCRVSPWDYDKSTLEYDLAAGSALRIVADNIGKFKAYVNYVGDFYKSQIEQWEGYREYCQKKFGKRTKKWTDYITNPDCLEFFEKYEKDHDIKDSIYQQAMKLKK